MIYYNDCKNFVHLHVHTIGSQLDGFCKIDDLINKVKELNMNAVAITDHGNLSETYTFWKKCNEANIKPILGIEAYHTLDRHMISMKAKEREEMAINKVEEDIKTEILKSLVSNSEIDIEKEIKKYKKENKLTKDKIKKIAKDKYPNIISYDTKCYHLILFAKNQTGWNNLIKLMATANEEGSIIKNKKNYANVDNELLKKYSEGLICTSACISSMICDSIRKDNILYAEQKVKELKDIFGDDFYLEIQPLNWDEQYKVNKELIKIAKKYNIKLIATTDCHYTFKDDYDVHDILVCIGTEKKVTDKNRMRYLHEYWVKDYDEMIAGFKSQDDSEEYIKSCIEALNNTIEVANKVEAVKLGSDENLLPTVDVPKGYTPDSWLSHQCWINLYKFLKKENKTDKRLIYEARLKHELNVIITKGFASYILIVQDAINWGNNNGCPFGPGRGSGAGSLVLFLLGIVKGTDPVEYNLLFSRFLTMDRVALPDIDSDVDMVNRQKLISYLEHKYGHENVCQVGTITKVGVKNGIKDVAKAFDIPFAEANQISKKLDELIEEPELSFKKMDNLKEDDPQAYKEWVSLQNQYPEVIKYARLLEGTNRSSGTHAGGVLITPIAVNNYFPTRINDKGKKITEWDKNIVEEARGVKYDFLGLATISVINLALSFIKENYDIDITLDELYNNKDLRHDENVFDMLKEQRTEGVFQMESNLFKGLMKGIQPDNINDLIAITAIGRPGPLGAGMDKKYANRKLGVEPIVMPIKGLDDILSDTFGTIIYQEQVMLMSQIVAGFDDNQADSYLRKSLAKKKKDIMELCKQWLIYGKPQKDKYGEPIEGGIARGYSEQELLEFWKDLEGYAKYLFNKSHATSYSLLSCITAYLKFYYPKEFFTAIMSLMKDQDRKKKFPNYIRLLENEFNIKIVPPNINESKALFSPSKDKDEILYGLVSIKGLGAKIIENNTIQEIIDNRPYNSIEDFFEKFDQSKINKKVGEALIEAGVFDSLYEDKNRNKLINTFYDIRKQKCDRLEECKYDRQTCIDYEVSRLEFSLTYKPWIEEMELGDTKEFECKIEKITEKIDKNGRLMAFVTVSNQSCNIELIVFATKYRKYLDIFDKYINLTQKLKVKGEKLEGNKMKFIKGSILEEEIQIPEIATTI